MTAEEPLRKGAEPFIGSKQQALSVEKIKCLLAFPKINSNFAPLYTQAD